MSICEYTCVRRPLTPVSPAGDHLRRGAAGGDAGARPDGVLGPPRHLLRRAPRLPAGVLLGVSPRGPPPEAGAEVPRRAVPQEHQGRGGSRGEGLQEGVKSGSKGEEKRKGEDGVKGKEEKEGKGKGLELRA